MAKQRITLEEKPVYVRGYIDEGIWFTGAVMSRKNGGTGQISFPLTCLPSALRRRARKGQPIWVRLLIAEDEERRVYPDSK